MNDDILKIIQETVEKLDNKIDILGTDIVDIKLNQKENTVDIRYHIKRTDLLEESVEMLRLELRPIKAHVNGITTIIKFITAASAVIGTIIGLLKLTGKI
jgi:hypothetical protein